MKTRAPSLKSYRYQAGSRPRLGPRPLAAPLSLLSANLLPAPGRGRTHPHVLKTKLTAFVN